MQVEAVVLDGKSFPALDARAGSFEEFLDFVFNRPPGDAEWVRSYDVTLDEYLLDEENVKLALDAVVQVAHMTRLWREFETVARRYSQDQVVQGLHALGHGGFSEFSVRCLFDERVLPAAAAGCVRAYLDFERGGIQHQRMAKAGWLWLEILWIPATIACEQRNPRGMAVVEALDEMLEQAAMLASPAAQWTARDIQGHLARWRNQGAGSDAQMGLEGH